MFKYILIASFSVLSCHAFAQTDPCSSLADLSSKSDPNSFVGFGAGTSRKSADDNAQIDLASRIRQKVTASSTVTENNASSNLESTSKSLVSEVLIGAKVLKRCAASDTFSTVVSLDKTLFISSLEKKLTYNITKAKNFLDTLNNSKIEQIIAENVDQAKKFIADYQPTFENDLQLCKIYNGCSKIKNEGVFSELADAVAKQGDKDQYLMITNGSVTENFRDELIDIAEKDGYKVMDGAVSGSEKSAVKRKIYAKCTAKVGSKIPGTKDKVLNSTCILEVYNGKQKKIRKVYTCKAMVDEEDISNEDAITSCAGRLQLQH